LGFILTKTKEHYIRLGIAVRIPMAFEKFCPDAYRLKQIPQDEDATEEDMIIINSLYEIYNPDNVKVASFKPTGEYECLIDDFKTIFYKIVEDLDYAAYKANKAQEEEEKRMDEEMNKKFGLKD
jgi:hypothetical protein